MQNDWNIDIVEHAQNKEGDENRNERIPSGYGEHKIPIKIPDIWRQLFLCVHGYFSLAKRGGSYMALANKIVRVAFALLKRSEDYKVTLATPV